MMSVAIITMLLSLLFQSSILNHRNLKSLICFFSICESAEQDNAIISVLLFVFMGFFPPRLWRDSRHIDNIIQKCFVVFLHNDH